MTLICMAAILDLSNVAPRKINLKLALAIRWLILVFWGRFEQFKGKYELSYQSFANPDLVSLHTFRSQ